MPSLRECATANNNDLAGQLLWQLYEKGANAVREALMHEIDGVPSGGGDSAATLRVPESRRDAADEIVRRCEVLEAKVAACDQEALRQVEMRSVGGRGCCSATPGGASAHGRGASPAAAAAVGDDMGCRVRMQRAGGAAWCAGKEHRANRPPLQMLVIDDWNFRMGQSAADLLAPIDKQVKNIRP